MGNCGGGGGIPNGEGQVARCLHHIPDEILESISVHVFSEEYVRLRSWVSAFRNSPLGREIINLVGCQVIQEAGGEPGEQGREVGHWRQQGREAGQWQLQGRVALAFWTDAGHFIEARGQTPIPAVGTYVHVQKHGRCRAQKVKAQVCNTILHRWVMSTPYNEISALEVWHVVRAYHRCTLLVMPSGSTTGSVGGVLADAAQCGPGTQKTCPFSSRLRW